MLLRAGFLLVFCFCSAGVWANDARLSIVTSIRPLALLVQDLAGKWADVEVVVPPNADPHNMSLKASARTKLDKADLVLWLGPDFERFLAKPMRQRKAGVDLSVGDVEGHHHDHDGHDHSGHGRDLHVWLNPKNAERILRALAARLLVLKPNLAASINARLVQVLQDIELAQKSVAVKLAPHKGKGFGVYHNAYGHFTEAFGLNMLAAVNQMPEQRISAKHLHQLQKDMVGASCIIVERKSAKTERLARVLKVKQVAADPLVSDKDIKSYAGFLLYLGGAFELCFRGG